MSICVQSVSNPCHFCVNLRLCDDSLGIYRLPCVCRCVSIRRILGFFNIHHSTFERQSHGGPRPPSPSALSDHCHHLSYNIITITVTATVTSASSSTDAPLQSSVIFIYVTFHSHSLVSLMHPHPPVTHNDLGKVPAVLDGSIDSNGIPVF